MVGKALALSLSVVGVLIVLSVEVAGGHGWIGNACTHASSQSNGGRLRISL